MNSVDNTFSRHRASAPAPIFYAFMLLLAWVPLPMASNRAWAWSIMEGYIFIMAVVWLILFSIGRAELTKAFVVAKPILYLLLLWLLFVLLQFIPLPINFIKFISPQAAALFSAVSGINPDNITISVDPHATKIAWIKSVAYVLFFIFTLLLIDTRKRVKILVFVIIFSGFAQALYGSIMTLSGLEYGFFVKKLYSLNVASGTFINRNHFANFIIMSLAVGVGWMISKTDPSAGEQNRKQQFLAITQWILSGKISMRLVLVAIVVGLVLTRSRMGNISFFFSLISTGILMWHFSKQSKLKLLALFVSMIIVDIYVMGAWFGIDQVVDRIQQTSITTEMRPHLFENSVKLWSDYLWVGSGLETFYSTFPAYKGAGMPGFFDHVHNDYLELLTEVGIVGFCLIVPVVVLSFWVGMDAMRNNTSRVMRGIAFASVMTIIAQMMHASVDFSLRIPANAAYMMVIMAMSWIATAGVKN
ncbi:MAG: O-antigen ligase family protein [Magnetococcales bacterium]|nr:O-antigen ligase family protein [Magnetococcales bacterium]